MTKKLVAISVIICNALFYVGCASLDSDNPALRLKAISECPRGFDFDLEDIDEYKEISRKLERIASNEGEREDIRVAAFAKLVERSDTEACVRIILNNETNEQVVSSFVALSNRSIGLLLTMHADAGIGVIEKVRPTLVKTDVRPIDSECIARSLNRCLSSNDAISNERAKSLIAAIDAHGDWVSVYMSLVSLHDAADENVVKLCVEKLFSNHRDEAFDVVMSLASTDRDQNKSVEIAAEWLLQMELTPQEIDSAIGKLAKRDVSTSQENILRRFCEKCQIRRR